MAFFIMNRSCPRNAQKPKGRLVSYLFRFRVDRLFLRGATRKSLKKQFTKTCPDDCLAIISTKDLT